jgi:tetratricopeptide (TPR) repeat protein
MKSLRLVVVSLLLSTVLAPAASVAEKEKNSVFEFALRGAQDALTKGNTGEAMLLIERALERDPKSSEAWGLRAELADRLGDRDDFVFSLNKQLTLLIAQKAPKKDIAALRERVVTVDPIAADVFKLRGDFIAKLRPIAEQYDKDERPHAAIRVWREILALDPELEDAQQGDRADLAPLPDPSLAGGREAEGLAGRRLAASGSASTTRSTPTGRASRSSSARTTSRRRTRATKCSCARPRRWSR